MTLKEFKLWLDGFTDDWHDLDTPTLVQWRRIREKLEEATREDESWESQTTGTVTIKKSEIIPYEPYTGDPLSPIYTWITCSGSSCCSCEETNDGADSEAQAS